MDDGVEVVALEEEAGLRPVAGEAVDDEAVVPVVVLQAPPDHLLDQVVADQLPGGDDPPDLGAQLGVVLDVPAEDVADVDVLQVEGVGQQLGLGALPLPCAPMTMYLRMRSPRLAVPGRRRYQVPALERP